MLTRQNQRPIAVWTVTGVAVMATAMGCSQQIGGGNEAVSAEPPVSTSIAMSYPTYDSLATLSQRADSIIVGQVASVASELVEMVPPEQKDKLPDYKKPSTRVVMSTYTIVPSDELKGKGAQSLLVTQPGGSHAGQRIENEDEQELTQGNKYLLFLMKIGERYAIVGGAQGAYVIDSAGRLKAHKPNGKDVRLKLHGRTLKSVENDPAIRSVGSGRSKQREDGPSEPVQKAPPEKSEAPKPG